MAKKQPLADDAGVQNNEARTLGLFIEANHRLLTVLGVFTAMTLFALNLPVRAIGGFLGFLFMAITILVWLELWSRFPSGGGQWRFTLFENLLSVSIIVLFFYWFTDFRAIWSQALILLVWVLLMGAVSGLMSRHDWFNRVFHTEPGGRVWLRYTVGITLLLATMVVALVIAALVAPPVNRFLDTAYSEFSTSQPTTDSAGAK